MQAQRIGVCILNWNSGGALLKCVDAVLVGRSSTLINVLIVDNASDDTSIALVKNEHPEIAILRSPTNRGYAAGNNLGANYLINAQCDVLVFVNPDVTVGAGTLDSLVRTLLDNPRAGCVGGIPVSGRRILAARTRPSTIEKLVCYGPANRISWIRRLGENHIIDPATLKEGAEVHAVCGACVAFRADAFRKSGGFDENTFLYEEEFIIAERLGSKGWRTVISTSARYEHVEGLATDRIPYRRRLHFIASEQYYLRAYRAWGALSLGLLKLIRMVEWCFYAIRWSVRHA